MTPTRAAAQRGEPRAAVAGRLPRAQRARLAGQGRRPARRARVHVSRVRGALPAASRRRSRARGVGRGDTVAVMAPNVPALLEAHYAVPGARRGAERAQLPARRAHASPSASSTATRRCCSPTREFAPMVKRGARARWSATILVVDIDDREGPRGERLGASTYEDCSRRAIRRSRGPARSTNGTRSRCSTPRARPAIRRASSITIAARI